MKLTAEQYALMVKVQAEGIRSSRLYDPALDSIRKYLAPYEYIDTYTTKGIVQRPYVYRLSEEGLFLKEEYEKLKNHHAEKTSQKARDKTSEKRLLRDLFISVVSTTVGVVVTILVERIIKLL